MTHPLANVPCPIRLSTNVIPTPQKMAADGTVVSALLVGGLSAAPPLSGVKAGCTVTRDSPLIALPPGTQVTDVAPGGQLQTAPANTIPTGSQVVAVHPGGRKPDSRTENGKQELFLSALLDDADVVPGARVFGAGIPTGTVVVATASQPQVTTVKINQADGTQLRPESTDGLVVGMQVAGPNVPAGARITAVTQPVIELDVNATGSTPAGRPVPVTFASLPLTVPATATLTAGQTNVTVGDTAGLVTGMLVTAAGVPTGAVVTGVTPSTKVVTISAAATVNGTGVVMVFTAPSTVAGSVVQTQITNAAGIPAFTKLVPDSLTDLATGMRVDRTGVPDGTVVQAVLSDGVNVNGVLPANATAVPTTFRETAFVKKTLTVATATGSIAITTTVDGLVKGMLVEAAGVPDGTVVTAVNASSVTLNQKTTAALAKGALVTFMQPVALATTTATCAQGLSKETVLTVTSAHAALLRKGMLVTATGVPEATTILSLDPVATDGTRQVTVNAQLQATPDGQPVSAAFDDVTQEVPAVLKSVKDTVVTMTYQTKTPPVPGMVVTDGGLPLGAVITAVTATTVTLDQSVSAVTAGQTVTFAAPYRILPGRTTRTEGIVEVSKLQIPTAGTLKTGLTLAVPGQTATTKVIKVYPDGISFDVDRVVGAVGASFTGQFRELVFLPMTLAKNSTAVTMASTAGLSLNMNVTAPGVPANATIRALSATGFTLSVAATAAGTGVQGQFELLSSAMSPQVTVLTVTPPSTRLTSLSGSSLAPGMQMVGAGVLPNTFITAVEGDQITINQTAHQTSVPLLFQQPWQNASFKSASGALLVANTQGDADKVTVGAAVSGSTIPAGTTVKSKSGLNITLTKAVTRASALGGPLFDVQFRVTTKDVTVPVVSWMESPASTKLSFGNVTGLAVGMKVSGQGIPDGARIASVQSDGVTINAAVAAALQNVVASFTGVVDTVMTNAAGTTLLPATTAGIVPGMTVTWPVPPAGMPASAQVVSVTDTQVVIDTALPVNASAVLVSFEATSTAVTRTVSMDAGTLAVYTLKPVATAATTAAATALTTALAGIAQGLTLSGTGVPAGAAVVSKSTNTSGDTVLSVTTPLPLALAAAGETVMFLEPVREVTGSFTNSDGTDVTTTLNVASATGVTPGMSVVCGTLVPPDATVTAVGTNTVTVDVRLAAITTAAEVLFVTEPAVVVANCTNAAGTGDRTVLTANGTGLAAGMLVGAPGVPAGAKIVSVSDTTVTIDQVATANATLVNAVFTRPPPAVYKTVTAATTAGVLTVKDLNNDTTKLVPGMGAVAVGLPPGAMVTGVTATTATINTQVSATFTGTVMFTQPAAVVVTNAVLTSGQTGLIVSDANGIAPGMQAAATGLPVLGRVSTVGMPAVVIDKTVPTGAPVDSADFFLPVVPRTTMQATLQAAPAVSVPSTYGLVTGQQVSVDGASWGFIASLPDDGVTIILSRSWTGTQATQQDMTFGAVIGLSQSCTSDQADTGVDIGPVVVMADASSSSLAAGSFTFSAQARTLAEVQEGDYCVVAVQVVSLTGDVGYLMAYGFVRNVNAGLQQFYLWDSETGGAPVQGLTKPDYVVNGFWDYGRGPNVVGVFQKPRLVLDSTRSRIRLRMLWKPCLRRTKAIALRPAPWWLRLLGGPQLTPVKFNEYVNATGLGPMRMRTAGLDYKFTRVALAHSVSKLAMLKAPNLVSSAVYSVWSTTNWLRLVRPPVLSGHEHVVAIGRSTLWGSHPVLEYGSGITLTLSTPATGTFPEAALVFTRGHVLRLASMTQGSQTLTLDGTAADIAPGMTVTGQGIPDGARVALPPVAADGGGITVTLTLEALDTLDNIPLTLANGRVTRTASVTQGSAVITLADGTLDLSAGMAVTGDGIADGTTVTLVPAATMSATVVFRAWASAGLLIEGLGLSVRDVAHDCLAVWNLRGDTVVDDIKDRVLSDINAAMQLIYSRARHLDYFNLTTFELEVPEGSNSVAIPADVQSIVGNVRTGPPGRMPLWALQSMAELEQFGPCYLGTPPGTRGTPLAYYVDRNSVGMALYIAPPALQSTVLEVDAAMEPPRFHWDDVVKATPLRLPHSFAETLLMPIVRQRATAFKFFTNDSLKPAIEAQYKKAMNALGLVDPAPPQAARAQSMDVDGRE